MSNPFVEWQTVDVVRRPTEDSAFRRLETLQRLHGRSLSQMDREVLALERQCLATKPHYGQSIAARATWITSAYNKRYGHGLAPRQTVGILMVCSDYFSLLSRLERN